MEKEIRNRLAEKEVNSSTLLSAGSGAIPFSYIDVGATIIIQMRMMKNLCDIYGVKWDEHITKSLIGSVLGNIGKRTMASMVKSVPFIGPIIGGAANAILSGVSTYALGNAFIKYMEVNSSIKNVKDINIGAFTNIYNDISKQASSIKTVLMDKIRGNVKSEKAEERSEERGGAKEPVVVYGERIFGSREKFNAWLQKPNQLIENKKPIELLLSSKEADHDKLRRLIEIFVDKKTKQTA